TTSPPPWWTRSWRIRSPSSFFASSARSSSPASSSPTTPAWRACSPIAWSCCTRAGCGSSAPSPKWMPPRTRCCASFSARTRWRYSKGVSAVHPFAWHNGRLVASDAIALSPKQSGLLTGWGLFSTLRIYQGIPFAWEDHWERLEQDATALRVSTAGLRSQAERGFAELIERNRAQESVARIYLIRNQGGLLNPLKASAGSSFPATDLLIFTLPLRAWGATARLKLQPHGRHAAAPLAGTKTLTWAHNLVQVEAANAEGFDDVLLLNERGEAAECTAANIYVARAGRLLTPPLSSGALPGVSRKVLLRAAPRHGALIEEAVLRPADLDAADEIFITSSTREVQPVACIGARAIPAGPMAGRAADWLRQEIEEYLQARLVPARPAAQPA